jgi:hypothetical protein
MHPRTDELLRHLDANRVVLRAAVDAVPAEHRETRPAPDRWSIAEVLEHLGRVEEQITRLLSLRLSEHAATLKPATDTTSILSRLDHRLIIDRRRRVTAGERVIPRGEMGSAQALASLEVSRTKLRELVLAYDGIAIDPVTHPHPVFGPIDAYQWLIFVGSHEARHADQIREIGAALTA